MYKKEKITVVDLGGGVSSLRGSRGASDARPPAQNFLIFKNWPNNRLVLPSGIGAPSGKTWIRHCPGPIFPHFHTLFKKHWSIVGWRPSPLLGNPRSATAYKCQRQWNFVGAEHSVKHFLRRVESTLSSQGLIFTARIRRMGKGNIFSLFTPRVRGVLRPGQVPGQGVSRSGPRSGWGRGGVPQGTPLPIQARSGLRSRWGRGTPEYLHLLSRSGQGEGVPTPQRG